MTPTVLEEQLCFAVTAAARAMVSCCQSLLTSTGLTHAQYMVMLILWEQEVSSLRELSDRLHLSGPTLSPIITRLEEADLLGKTRNTVDARVVDVYLTSQGRRLRSYVDDVPSRLTSASGMTPDEMTALRDVLQILTMRLRGAEHHRLRS